MAGRLRDIFEDVTCTMDCGNGLRKYAVVRAAFEFEAKRVCEFLCGAMSHNPDAKLYQGMMSHAVRGLDSSLTDGKLAICDAWARSEFGRIEPASMSPAERSSYCEGFGPNALRLWWEVVGERVSHVESFKLDALTKAPTPSRSPSRATSSLRL